MLQTDSKRAVVLHVELLGLLIDSLAKLSDKRGATGFLPLTSRWSLLQLVLERRVLRRELHFQCLCVDQLHWHVLLDSDLTLMMATRWGSLHSCLISR